jgi:transcriptional regulator GlxA family with amidase domain
MSPGPALRTPPCASVCTPSCTPLSARGAAAPADSALHIVFLTLRDYSMIALSNALEVLRMANRASGRQLYRWTIATLDGQPARASNGLPLAPTVAIGQADAPDMLLVCGGVRVREACPPQLDALLARFAGQGTVLGGLCTGSYALVKAGLMKGYRCAVHWEQVASLREEFTGVDFSDGLFAIDRDRITCSGGTAPIDLMLHLTATRHGKPLADAISAQFTVERMRDAAHRQHVPLAARLGFGRAELVLASTLMETHVEEPLCMAELAHRVGLSPRQLQRMFRHYLDMAPHQYYLRLRLGRARELLTQTGMSIMDVMVACGFESSCHFSKAYREQFGHPPSAERPRSPSASPTPSRAVASPQPPHAVQAASSAEPLPG